MGSVASPALIDKQLLLFLLHLDNADVKCLEFVVIAIPDDENDSTTILLLEHNNIIDRYII